MPMEMADAPQESLPLDQVNNFDHDAFDPVSNHFRIMHDRSATAFCKSI